MPALELDRMSWPDVRDALATGRDTVVMALGATEQHGPHMALATDAVLGDHLARAVADRLEAFLAPTVRIGCSSHHLAFPGTLSLEEDTFHRVVGDVVRSLARGGFHRIVLLPTHGGNFAPLANAVAAIGPLEGVRVIALTDLGVLFGIAELGRDEHGVPLAEGGLHAGEWETSMLLAIAPEHVHMERAQPGFTGDPQAALGTVFEGVHALSANGILGDPARASAEHGRRYVERAVELVLDQIDAAG
jgi:creatinine amidohydrolase